MGMHMQCNAGDVPASPLAVHVYDNTSRAPAGERPEADGI